jgi:hypothetical protein
MSGKIVTIFSVIAWVLLFPVGLFAHHGVALYDVNQMINVTGTVTDFQFVNPHVRILFDVTEEDETVVAWSAELTTPIRLREVDGWNRDTLKPGNEISVTGSPATDGSPSIWVEQVFFDDNPLLIRPGGAG